MVKIESCEPRERQDRTYLTSLMAQNYLKNSTTT